MFFYILIGFIVLVIVLFSIGYMLRKKHYTIINELEEKKLKLRDRPIIEELSKVKKLKLTGQTEQLFEKWRSSWDEIETQYFPEAEQELLEAEVHVDNYRFKSATKSENNIEQMLVIIEKQMDQILDGLQELLCSEEKNTQEGKEIKEEHLKLRREILTRGFKLGEALPFIEKEFEVLSEQINQYNTLTSKGDHLEAREIIAKTKSELNKLSQHIEQIPSLLHETNKVLPKEIQNLRSGYDEMVHKGYYLNQMDLKQELKRLDRTILEIKEKIYKGKVEQATSNINEVHSEINHLYDVLQQEVVARGFVKENKDTISESLTRQIQVSNKLASQITEVKLTYHLSEEEIAAYLRASSLLFEQQENFDQIFALLAKGEVAYSAVQDTLKEIGEKLDQIALDQKQISEELRSLRKDELEIRDKLKKMALTLNQINRHIERARLPGVPEGYEALKEHTQQSINKLETRLKEKPLNMKVVLEKYGIANEDLEHLAKKADELIENARLVEQTIQYANRYRLHNEALAKALQKAEKHFYQDYNYEKALEVAVTSLEEVEAGAFKKIEKNYASELENL